MAGEYELATAAGRECQSLFEQFANLIGSAASHALLAAIALAQEDLPDARHHAGLAAELEREIASQSGRTKTPASCVRLGEIALVEGDLDAAEALYQEALAIARDMSTVPHIVEALAGLGWVALRRDDPRAAASHFVEVLCLTRDWRPGPNEVWCLEGLACALILEAGSVGAQGPHTAHSSPHTAHSGSGLCAVRCALCASLRAARHLGVAEAVRERIGIQRSPREQSEHEGWTTTLCAALGDAAFTAAREAGRALSWNEAIAAALGELT
jgi:hypothetical protein